MADAMVTGRMSASKKSKGNAILKRMGVSASEAINLLYDRVIADQDITCVQPRTPEHSRDEWKKAFEFVDGIPKKRKSRFGDMTIAEAKTDRLKSKGLL